MDTIGVSKFTMDNTKITIPTGSPVGIINFFKLTRYSLIIFANYKTNLVNIR